MEAIKTRIKHLYSGKVENLNDGKRKPYKSAYRKNRIENRTKLFVATNGFINDQQGDTVNHGGSDKAVCVYSQKYYDAFQRIHEIELPECAFGENITIFDLDDSEICIGDRFKCGEVIFEVSQPRQPCWKISSILGIKNLTSLIVKEYKTGFYLRVIQEGYITSEDNLELISREYSKLTIEFVNRCAYNAKENQENIKEILSCPKLAEAYHKSLSKRYKDKEYGIQEWQKDEYIN